MGYHIKYQSHLTITLSSLTNSYNGIQFYFIRDWLEDIFTRAGITGFLPHDLRRTFATLVTASSNDEFLAMRLIRDKVPGLSDRYVNYPLAQLVAALEKYSPQRQATKLVPPPTRGNPGPGAGDAVPAVVETTQPRAVSPPEAGNKSGGDGGGSVSTGTTIY
jgi:hypothetical protein